MATTKIWGIYETLDNALYYITKKTKLEFPPYSYGCPNTPNEAADEMLYILNHDSQGKANRNTLAKHIYQSFAPGEVTPEQANRIGRLLADELLGGEYSYVLATHIDKAHIHNHIIFCSVNFNTYRTFETEKNRGGKSYKDIQKISDKLCKMYGLSVIEQDEKNKNYSKDYCNYVGIDKKNTWQNKLKKLINFSIGECKNFDEFLEFMHSNGVEVVYRPDNEIKLKFRMTGQQKFTRAKTLGYNYDVAGIEKRIKNYQLFLTGENEKESRKLIDTTTEFMENSPFLKRWAEHKNALELAELVNKLTAENDNKLAEGQALIVEIDDLNLQIESTNSIIKDRENYSKYKPIFEELNAIQSTNFSNTEANSFKKKFKKELALFKRAEENLRILNDTLDDLDIKLAPLEVLKSDVKTAIDKRNLLIEKQRKLAEKVSEISAERREVEEYLKQQGIEINLENKQEDVQNKENYYVQKDVERT